MSLQSAFINSTSKCSTRCSAEIVGTLRVPSRMIDSPMPITPPRQLVNDGTRSVPTTAFELFDPTGDLRITVGNLPHWFQPGATYFVTFRTEDSLPADVAESWHCRRDDWLRRQKISPISRTWRQALQQLPIE